MPMSDTTVPESLAATGLSARTIAAGHAVLDGNRRGPAAMLPFIGPAVVASIAYMDPGNFATNIQAGANYGYLLLWVVVVANVLAMLFQAVSARIGIATGSSLAELSRRHFPAPLVLAMWAISEVAAMATDLAESLGAAIGLHLLVGLPLLGGLVLTFAATWAMLSLQGRGFRPIELLIGGFIGVIGIAYLIELVIAPPDWGAFAFHAVVPRLAGPDSLTLAVGIIGATVMPHAIYLHSNLTQNRVPARNAGERAKLIRYSNREVVVALGIAGLINMAMLASAASAFHIGHSGIASIETAYHTLVPLLGAGAGVAFMAALLASGLSSSVVGTMAGQAIMRDFTGWRLKLWIRRAVTMLPAVVVVALGVDATRALVLSQVVLSLALPVPMLALLALAGRADVMGASALRRPVLALVAIGAAIVLMLNIVLLLSTAGVALPGLG